MYFDKGYSAARFPSYEERDLFPGYNPTEQVYLYSYSFLKGDPFAEYAELKIPLVVVGNKTDSDREVNVSVDTEKTTIDADTYEVLESIIPAGDLFGYTRIKVYNAAELDVVTRSLYLKINNSFELLAGPAPYDACVLLWNNSVVRPTVANNIRTYNFLIQSGVGFSSTSAANYSPAAHKLILKVLGWEDLPSYTIIYVGDAYKAYAAKIADYIAAYNAANPGNPLLHDDGGLKGQPIQARVY
jgi:hypothetical protein